MIMKLIREFIGHLLIGLGELFLPGAIVYVHHIPAGYKPFMVTEYISELPDALTVKFEYVDVMR